MSSAADIASARRRRGASRGSVTRLTKKLKDLEGRAGNPATLAAAQQMKKSLENVDVAFKTHHFSLIELIEADADLEKEQEVLDAHDELVDDLLIRTDRLILSCTVNVDPELRSTTSKRITRLEKTISTVDAEIAKISDPPIDLCLVRQREEQLHGLKQDLNDIGKALVTLDLDDKDELMVRHTALDTKIFEDSLQLKRMIQDSIASTDSRGVKLPKLDVPVFNGNILHWSTFWEQFTVAVHSRKDISDSEKLVYLRQSLREGSAKNAIEGLSRTGDNYAEAVECLKARYDRPRLIHQTHVKKILEIPVLKTGNGRELRHLHDVVQQHLRALKSMGYEPSAPFITSVLELKLNVGTMFEWQKHSNSSTGVPHFNELLEFINLCAQASEHTTSGSKRAMGSGNHATNSVTSFAANTQSPTTADSCVLCKTDVHPLFACSKFKSLPRDRMVATVKANNLCLNCLRPGHHLKHCKSLHKCRECQRPHHTLLHIDKGEPSMTQTPTGYSSTSSSPPALPSLCVVTYCNWSQV